MKRNGTVFSLVALLVFAFGLSAFAAGDMRDQAPAGDPQAQMEKRDARFDALYANYEKTVMPLHDKLSGKFLELRALEGLNTATKDDVLKVVGEINALRTQIRAEHQKFNDALAKEGLPRYAGYHRGGMGGCYGGCPGMGKGMMGRGYGASDGCPGMGMGKGMMGGGRGHGGWHGGGHGNW